MKIMTQFQAFMAFMACMRQVTMPVASSGAATMTGSQHAHTFGRLAGQSIAGLTADEPGKAVAQEAHVDAASGASHI